MGFTLQIKNTPSSFPFWYSAKWSGSYGTITSGWLDIDEIWECSYGAYGTTNLTIMVVDQSWNHVPGSPRTGLGPINDGEAYIYDYSAGTLTKVIPEWFEVYSGILQLDVSVIAHWYEVYSGTLQVNVGVAAHWYQVYSGVLQLDIKSGNGNGNGDDEEPKEPFPWIPVALIGGGAAVAIAAATSKPKTEKKMNRDV